MSKTAIKLLFVSHPADASLLQKIKEHLHFPIQNGAVDLLESYQLSDQNSNSLTEAIKTADLVVSLVSDSLLGQYEALKPALETADHAFHILTTPSEWTKHLTAKTILPKNRLPITSWELEDDALLSITKELLEIADSIEPKTIEQTTTSTLSALEREGLEQQQQILTEKLSYLRKNMATMSEGAKKFELMKDIEQVEKEVKEIQEKLNG